MFGDDDDLNGPNDEELEIEGDEEGQPGLGDDEGGDEVAGDEEAQRAEAEEGLAARQPSRAARRIQETTRVAREASEKAARLEREIAELRAERQKPQGETAQEEAARLSLMTAEERMDYKLDKATREHARQMNLVRFESADRADKAAFEAKGSYSAHHKKYAPEVEQLLADERRAGRDFPRETILAFVLGRKVMAGGKEVSAQRKAGQQRVASQRASAGNSGSDRTAPRGRAGSGNSLSDLEKRLDGVVI